MSETATKGFYVYQPFGTISHPVHAKFDRLFAVSAGHRSRSGVDPR